MVLTLPVETEAKIKGETSDSQSIDTDKGHQTSSLVVIK